MPIETPELHPKDNPTLRAPEKWVAHVAAFFLVGMVHFTSKQRSHDRSCEQAVDVGANGEVRIRCNAGKSIFVNHPLLYAQVHLVIDDSRLHGQKRGSFPGSVLLNFNQRECIKGNAMARAVMMPRHGKLEVWEPEVVYALV